MDDTKLQQLSAFFHYLKQYKVCFMCFVQHLFQHNAQVLYRYFKSYSSSNHHIINTKQYILISPQNLCPEVSPIIIAFYSFWGRH